MSIESIIGVTSGLIAIGGTIYGAYKLFKKKPLTEQMNSIVDKKQTSKQHRKALKTINVFLGGRIKTEYIQNFVLADRGKESVFLIFA